MQTALKLKSEEYGGELIQLASFNLEKEEYGINVLMVREIIRMLNITRVPNTPHYVEDVINLRGKVIPIISLRRKFDMVEAEYDKRARIMVMEVVGEMMGFIVDEVSEVIRISEKLGASTGGPVALQEVLSRIPVNFPHGIVVAIHMPKAFTGPYADRLSAKCSLSIREAADGDVVRGGEVLIAPGGRHTSLVRQGNNIVLRIVPATDYPNYIYIPSIDLMMTSFCDASGGSMLGVILTGMGNDGFRGMQHLKGKGGVTLVQNEQTSTIYGMPRACIEGHVADVVLPLDQIGFEIGEIAG